MAWPAPHHGIGPRKVVAQIHALLLLAPDTSSELINTGKFSVGSGTCSHHQTVQLGAELSEKSQTAADHTTSQTVSAVADFMRQYHSTESDTMRQTPHRVRSLDGRTPV
jgi:hypothetical protein